MRHFKKVLFAGALLALLAQGQGYAVDTEWPPAPDPHKSGVNPAPSVDIRGSKITLTLPSAFAAWTGHQHAMVHGHGNGWGFNPELVTVGDVHGADDGETNVVISVAEDVVMVCNVTNINWTNNTATVTPLFGWKTPICPANPSDAHGSDCINRNALVWDFDQDGSNEIAVVASASKTGTVPGNITYHRKLYLLSEPDNYQNPANGWFATGIPMADLDAQTPLTYDYMGDQGSPNTILGERIGLCRVQDTVMNGNSFLPYSANVWTTEHSGYGLGVWSIARASGVWSISLLYSVDSSYYKTHEFNAADVDGDGYDEFMMGGVRDFVDKNPGTGQAQSTNGSSGVQRWSSDIGGGSPPDHIDRMIAADFDPDNPGLEILASPDCYFHNLWHPTSNPNLALHEYDVLFDKDGVVLRNDEDRVNSDEANHPGWNTDFGGGDNIQVGNWTKDDPATGSPGLEIICTVKSTYAPYEPGGPEDAGNIDGTFTLSCEPSGTFGLGAVDGGYWHDDVKDSGSYPDNTPGCRASGPVGAVQIDWDGDHASDEILSSYLNTVAVWRLGKKGDWGGTYPSWMPTQTQLQSGWTESGQTRTWYYYQGGGASWQWNNGGPGRGTHYFQKLGEDFASGANLGSHEDWAFDFGKDYREEIMSLSTGGKLLIYHNTGALPDFGDAVLYSPNDPNPRDLADRYDPTNWPQLLACYEYRKFRQQNWASFTPPLAYPATVVTSSAPVANFSVSTDPPPAAGYPVQFTDTSTNTPTFWAWDFDNNGVIDSTQQNPQWTYASGGTKTVKLIVVNAAGSDDVTLTVNVQTPTTIVFYSASADDGWILESSEDSSQGGSVNSTDSNGLALLIGDDRTDRQYRSLVSFNTASIPDNAIILSSTIRLRKGGGYGTNPFTTHGTCIVGLKQGFYSDSQPLETGDFSATGTRFQVTTLDDPDQHGNVSTGVIDYTFSNMIKKDGYTQFRIHFATGDNDDGGTDYTGFYSGEASAGNRPTLDVVYVTP